jgi:3'-phosphoadenosine 5'-phosphosulfate (PAPS) 3'-phosphatase
MQKKIVLLAADTASSKWLFHSLKTAFPFAAVIIEQPISKKLYLKIGYGKLVFSKCYRKQFFLY